VSSAPPQRLYRAALNFSDQVQILDSSTCNSTTKAGVARLPRKVSQSFLPVCSAKSIEATHTLYMPSAFPNILAVIDTSVCNASTTAGCTNYAQVEVGFSGFAAVLIPQTKTVYVENFSSTSCRRQWSHLQNALDHSGCNQKPPVLATDRSGTVWLQSSHTNVSTFP